MRSGYNINSKNVRRDCTSAIQLEQHTKYAYENPEEIVQVSSNRNDTSRTVAKNPEESARAPNEWNKYYQELQRTGIFLLTDISTTGETINRLLTGTVTKILFENYKQRDTRGPLTKIYSLLKMPNLSKEDH